MQFFITGIDGFVGRHLTDLLVREGHGVGGTVFPAVPSPPPFAGTTPSPPLYPCDIRDEGRLVSVLNQVRPQRIVHLAAQAFVPRSWDDPAETLATNVEGTLNLLEACRGLAIPDLRILFVSSATVYGKIDPARLPVDEEHPTRPKDPYAISKLAGEHLCLAYGARYGLDIVVARAFNHIGPGQRDSFVASAFARQVALMEVDRAPAVLQVGNLEPERDFTDVRDVAEAYRLLALHGRGGSTYNVGSGRSIRVGSILETLEALTERPFRIEAAPDRVRQSENPVVRCDVSRLREATDWAPRVPFDDSIRDCLDYWRASLGTA